MVDRWDAEAALQLIERYKITHTHMVATMFHRLLQLPDDVKAKYDVSALRFIIHGAAPTPVHVKRAIIEWFGPIVWEYYAATEGGGGFMVGPEEWLTKPGTVGRPGPGFDNKILDEAGNELPAGKVGTVYMRAPERGRFEYFKDKEKTSKSYRGEYFTLGDLGYFDEDGYLFLTGRSAELIISGGVNIYPQEVDNELMKHPAVLDVCTVGVDNDEWGEEVKSVVQLRPGYEASDDLTAELMTWARERLANFKCPRSIDYAAELPRLSSGKIQRRVVRDWYVKK
jgi:long-chain acyl-CoA synthetase